MSTKIHYFSRHYRSDKGREGVSVGDVIYGQLLAKFDPHLLGGRFIHSIQICKFFLMKRASSLWSLLLVGMDLSWQAFHIRISLYL